MSLDATLHVWTLTKEQVTATEKLVLLSLADRANEDFECWPSKERLILDTCLDRHTVYKCLRSCEKKNLIERSPKKKGSLKNISIYKILGVTPREKQKYKKTSINGEIHTDKTSINGEIHTDKTSINGEIHTDKTSINGEIHTDKTSINGEIHTVNSGEIHTVNSGEIHIQNLSVELNKRISQQQQHARGLSDENLGLLESPVEPKVKTVVVVNNLFQELATTYNDYPITNNLYMSTLDQFLDVCAFAILPKNLGMHDGLPVTVDDRIRAIKGHLIKGSYRLPAGYEAHVKKVSEVSKQHDPSYIKRLQDKEHMDDLRHLRNIFKRDSELDIKQKVGKQYDYEYVSNLIAAEDLKRDEQKTKSENNPEPSKKPDYSGIVKGMN